MAALLPRIRIDPYIVALFATVAVATILPARGQAATATSALADAAVALLFFLYGGRLARSYIVAGLKHWRLQLAVFLATFGLFPLIGLGLSAALAGWMAAPLLAGIVFLCLLPSTVQSSIAFTSIARGNVPGAICAATVSNLAGVVLTPALVAGVLERGAGSMASLGAIWKIVFFLLLPFIVGHALRPWIGEWLAKSQRWLSYVDRGAILLIVYTAFSEGVVSGLWRQLPPADLAWLVALCAGLLGVVLVITTWTARRLGFVVKDEIVVVFCGSKKSLASGLPMAKLLFAGPAVGMIVLPLMIFHQLQLMVCAALARRYARRPEPEREVSASP